MAKVCRYVEVSRLRLTTSGAVISHLKAILSRHGIPEVLQSDNDPLFRSKLSEDFSKDYKIEHHYKRPSVPTE